MKLYYEHKNDFDNLVILASQYKNIPESAVRRDYLIVNVLEKLESSIYTKTCVFKGGTSLSKCYPGIIDRFSEDIDLTYISKNEISDKEYEKILKTIEKIMSEGLNFEKITSERNKRNKSSFIWIEDRSEKVKLEIGSSVRPDPYSVKSVKSYIHEYLEFVNAFDDIQKYGLNEVKINVLDISRTFVDKIMAIKRHALAGNLKAKARHIYDVVRLYQVPEIKTFIENKPEFKRLLKITKETDSYYMQKRDISPAYNPLLPYDFQKWKNKFNDEVKTAYETLHVDLLYTNEKQNFKDAIDVFLEINDLFQSIDE